MTAEIKSSSARGFTLTWASMRPRSNDRGNATAELEKNDFESRFNEAAI